MSTTEIDPKGLEGLREQITQKISFAIQGVREYTPKDITDYYRNRDAWVDSMTEEIMSAVEALLVEREGAADKKGYERGYNTGWIKARRSHDERRLTIAAQQLEALAKMLRQSVDLTQPPDGKDGKR